MILITVVVFNFKRQNYLQKITSLNCTSVEEINHCTGSVGAIEICMMQPHPIWQKGITSALQLL